MLGGQCCPSAERGRFLPGPACAHGVCVRAQPVRNCLCLNHTITQPGTALLGLDTAAWWETVLGTHAGIIKSKSLF